MPRQALQAYALPPEAELTHWWLGCNHCHALHDGTTNLHLISEVIDTDDLPPAYAPKTGPRDVVFLSLQGPNSYADGDGVYDGVCEVCHTETKYHRGDASGDHTHFPGANCSTCHDHANYFQPTGITDHPQAVTDCSNCHLGATGEPDLLGVHDYACQTCHPGGFDRTILGLIGVWQGDCTECHNPSVPETGNLETPTKGHHCVVCHGSQLPTSNPRQMHKDHVDDANCVVCHGFIPDTGTEVGSGNRAICLVCHSPGKHDSARHPVFHKKHAPKGVSCLECHGGERPPVDVVEGPPVGGSSNVCQVCHKGRSPSDFGRGMDRLHKKHLGESMDCGFCHGEANLQDDRDPMPGYDDPVRVKLDRAWYNECRFCHGSDEFDSSQTVHEKHVAGQWQWCYNCHDASDSRPRGLEPPVTQPAESCLLCHDDTRYDAEYPFLVHRKHSDEDVKCYACHQLTPRLFDWPATWMAPNSIAGQGPSGLESANRGMTEPRRPRRWQGAGIPGRLGPSGSQPRSKHEPQPVPRARRRAPARPRAPLHGNRPMARASLCRPAVPHHLHEVLLIEAPQGLEGVRVPPAHDREVGRDIHGLGAGRQFIHSHGRRVLLSAGSATTPNSRHVVAPAGPAISWHERTPRWHGPSSVSDWIRTAGPRPRESRASLTMIARVRLAMDSIPVNVLAHIHSSVTERYQRQHGPAHAEGERVVTLGLAVIVAVRVEARDA